MAQYKDTDINQHALLTLEEQKSDLIQAIHEIEEERLDLLTEIRALEHELQLIKSRYRKEQQLNQQSKSQVDKLHKSYSWRLTQPIRKIGGLFKMDKAPQVKTINKVDYERANARDLERKLWAGYAAVAYKELHELKQSSHTSLNERLRAMRALARWYFDREEYEKAYQELEYINDIKPLNNPNPDRVVTEIKVLKKLNMISQAKKMVWHTIKARGLQPELCLSMAHLASTDFEKLNWYNLLYDMHGYDTIRKINKDQRLELTNIQKTSTKIARQFDQYKISIIIPAYRAADLIHIALNSLLNQTLQNIEIIVVDDCSPDDTADVVEQFTKQDERIKLIRKQKNEGAYAARNTGLAYVTGDFVTVHDSDDWSHPQKLEQQLKALLHYPNAVGSISFLARTTKDVTPINAGSLLGSKFLIMNSSSLLIRRGVIEQLGGWDSVRVAGDSEFIWRIEKVYGKESIVRVAPNLPLSLALAAESSLTGTGTTHVKTIMFGLRRTYREAFEWWHGQAESTEDLYLDPSQVNRKFPCPIPNQINQKENRVYHHVFIADFSDESNIGRLVQVLKQIDEGEKQAIFHWPKYTGNPYQRIADDVFAIVDQKQIDLLVPNEEIKANQIVCLTPSILDYPFDQTHTPNITSQQAYIMIDETMTEQNRQKREENFTKTLNLAAKWCKLNDLFQVEIR